MALEQFGSYHLLQTGFSFFIRLLSHLVAVSSGRKKSKKGMDLIVFDLDLICVEIGV